jgi:hypothetical protein
MPVYYQSNLEEISVAHQGIRVEAAAALITTTPGRTLFTVSGGNVIMTGFYGEVIVVFPGTACTMTLLHTPTTGTVSTIASGATDITGSAAGSCLALPAVLAATLTLTATAEGSLVKTRYILRPGIMSFYGSAAPATGTVRFTMFYVPMEPGAYVTGV